MQTKREGEKGNQNQYSFGRRSSLHSLWHFALGPSHACLYTGLTA